MVSNTVIEFRRNSTGALTRPTANSSPKPNFSDTGERELKQLLLNTACNELLPSTTHGLLDTLPNVA
jgi:hypothetical protein